MSRAVGREARELTAPRAASDARHLVRTGALSVKAWLEDHLWEPGLTLEAIARSNGISLRYLHSLFTLEGISVFHWIWNRRLERSYDALLNSGVGTRSLTKIAYRVGFSSSSHFSTLFRRKFGVRPSDVGRGG